MANNIAISYDLKGPSRNYPAVAKKIKELGGWAKVNESFWYVDSVFTAAQARDHILPALDSNDKLFVVNATNGQAAWHNLSDQVASYLRNHWSR